MSKEQAVRRLRGPNDEADARTLSETMTALIKEAHLQKQQGRNGRLSARDDDQPRGGRSRSPLLPEGLQALLIETNPKRRFDDLVLNRETRDEMAEFVAEFAQSALLRSHSLEPRHTVLLVGPPGTGKTSLAGATARELALPFLTVRYDGLVGSYLGETASRLQTIIDYVVQTPCVLFFDEFESVGKERADAQETGEIKRVVSSLLLHMDALPANCVVICATNHPELLDRAVWRRFEIRIEMPAPGAAELKEWYVRTQKSFGPIGMTAQQFTSRFKGETLSEVEAVTLDARRKLVLSRGSMTPEAAFAEALTRWERRRAVGGGTSGSRSGGKNSSRTARARADTGAQATLPEIEAVPGAEE